MAKTLAKFLSPLDAAFLYVEKPRETIDSLRQAVRDCDLLARYGGEEFAVLVAGTTPEEFMNAAAERVRQFVEQRPDAVKGSTTGHDQLRRSGSQRRRRDRLAAASGRRSALRLQNWRTQLRRLARRPSLIRITALDANADAAAVGLFWIVREIPRRVRRIATEVAGIDVVDSLLRSTALGSRRRTGPSRG